MKRHKSSASAELFINPSEARTTELSAATLRCLPGASRLKTLNVTQSAGACT